MCFQASGYVRKWLTHLKYTQIHENLEHTGVKNGGFSLWLGNTASEAHTDIQNLEHTGVKNGGFSLYLRNTASEAHIDTQNLEHTGVKNGRFSLYLRNTASLGVLSCVDYFLT